VTLGLDPSFLRRSVFAQELARGAARGGARDLVCLFQRGAADALNVVGRSATRAYYACAPIAVAGRARGAGGATTSTASSASPVARAARAAGRRHARPVHAVAARARPRSHFDAQDYMETPRPT
jgi:uncharacterized protein (DUF1501 family)